MPRYFFNLHLGEDVLADPEGQELRDADQAWELAQAMAHGLMETTFERPVNWAASHIEVKDERDEIILEFPFLEALQLKPPPRH